MKEETWILITKIGIMILYWISHLTPKVEGQTITDSQYMGCWQHNPTLWTEKILGLKMSVGHCITICRISKFSFAALRNGDQCYCGKAYRTQESDECNHGYGCEGDSIGICGFKNQNSVYKTCPRGKHGSHCEKSCTSECGVKDCLFDGTCMEECPLGYMASSDDSQCQPCSNGTYGTSCTECKSCLNLNCDPVTGACRDGCISPADAKGPWCAQKCSDAPAPKDNPTGECPFCSHCKDKTCIGETNYCVYKCPVKWEGTKCVACEVGLYGDFCEKKCPEHCFDNICDFKTGNCQFCPVGWAGPRCDTKGTCDGTICTTAGTECKGTFLHIPCGEHCAVYCDTAALAGCMLFVILLFAVGVAYALKLSRGSVSSIMIIPEEDIIKGRKSSSDDDSDDDDKDDKDDDS